MKATRVQCDEVWSFVHAKAKNVRKSTRAGDPTIEPHNAKNIRKHSISRCEHIVVSFVEGERPTREQMALIEDRLMEAIGFGDHPRVSAVHKPDGRNVNNWHLHVVVSRIDPTTLKAEHPRFNHFSLQAEAARLGHVSHAQPRPLPRLLQ